MQHFFVDASQVSEETIRIEGTDVNHMKNVLRMRIGEEVTVSDCLLYTSPSPRD